MSSPCLEITTAIPDGGCPVACCFCPADKTAANYTGPRLMTLETFAACLAKMPAGTDVSFAGYAEPWLNHRATDMCEETARRGVPFRVYTTCVGMNESDVDRLALARPFQVTLHLPDVQGYAKIRCDAKYVAVVRRLKEKLPAVAAMTMGTLPAALVQVFGNLDAAYMHSRAGNVTLTVRQAPPRKRGPLRCRPGPELDRNVLLPDGTLTLCCADFGVRHVIGNLLTQSWEEIRAGEPLAKLRAAMASHDGDCLCRTCEYAESALVA